MAVASKRMTYEELKNMEFPDDDRFLYELINGELERRSAPNPRHQRLVGKLFRLMQTFAEEKELGEAFTSPIDIYLDEENVPQPDLVFVKKERASIVNLDECIEGAPDIVVEIISPSSVRRDRFDKKELYQRFGILEYWLIDPNNETIEIYQLQNRQYELHSFAAQEGIVQSSVLEEFELEVQTLFAK